MKSGLDRVSFVPIRHHSPACALAVRAAARDLRPCEILIEGPHDFTPQMDQLALPHRLPIAIYSYIREADGATSGAYYPFCRYSPEWQALEAARELGVPARFIDLPWAGRLREEEEVEGEDQTINAFAEPRPGEPPGGHSTNRSANASRASSWTAASASPISRSVRRLSRDASSISAWSEGRSVFWRRRY